MSKKEKTLQRIFKDFPWVWAILHRWEDAVSHVTIQRANVETFALVYRHFPSAEDGGRKNVVFFEVWIKTRWQSDTPKSPVVDQVVHEIEKVEGEPEAEIALAILEAIKVKKPFIEAQVPGKLTLEYVVIVKRIPYRQETHIEIYRPPKDYFSRPEREKTFEEFFEKEIKDYLLKYGLTV